MSPPTQQRDLVAPVRVALTADALVLGGAVDLRTPAPPRHLPHNVLDERRHAARRAHVGDGEPPFGHRGPQHQVGERQI